MQCANGWKYRVLQIFRGRLCGFFLLDRFTTHAAAAAYLRELECIRLPSIPAFAMLQTQTAATRFTVRSRAHASASASSRAAAAPLRRRSVTVAAAGGPRFGSSGGDGGGNGEKLAWVCGSCGAFCRSVATRAVRGLEMQRVFVSGVSLFSSATQRLRVQRRLQAVRVAAVVVEVPCVQGSEGGLRGARAAA